MMANKNKKKKINVLIIQSAHFVALFSICTIVPRHILPIPVAYYGMLV